MNHNHIDTKMAPTTTTTRPRSHDQKRIKHSTSMPIQDSHRRSSGFRYSCINNSGSSLNSILEVDQDQDRREEATTTPSSRLSRSSSTPLPFTVTQSPTQSPTTTVIAHTDFWHSTRTMKKTQTCTSLNGLLDIVSMENDDDDDDDDEEELSEEKDDTKASVASKITIVSTAMKNYNINKNYNSDDQWEDMDNQNDDDDDDDDDDSEDDSDDSSPEPDTVNDRRQKKLKTENDKFFDDL